MALAIPHDVPSDEIDLRELFISLWHAKLLILCVTVIITCIAAGYAFLSAPIFEASVRLLPPKVSDLVSYNAASLLTSSTTNEFTQLRSASQGIPPLTTKDAYNAFLQNLDSNSVKREFFENYYLPIFSKEPNEGDKQKLWKRLNSQLTIHLPKKQDDVVTTISFEGETPKTITEWANRYVALAAKTTQKDFMQNLNGEVTVREQNISSQIAALRKVAQTLRESQIVRITNALTIAKSIGLEEPSVSPPLIAINNASTKDISTLSSDNMMYLRGAKALSSELALLKTRQNEDAYIPDLGDLLKQKNLLSSIDLNPAHLTVMDIDQTAMVPSEPIRPRKALALAIGLVLGALLGVLAAVLRKAFSA